MTFLDLGDGGLMVEFWALESTLPTTEDWAEESAPLRGECDPVVSLL